MLEFATFAQASGQAEQAASLYSAAMLQVERPGTPLPPNVQADHDARLHALRFTLGESEFALLWSEGAGLSLEQAIDFAAVL